MFTTVYGDNTLWNNSSYFICKIVEDDQIRSVYHMNTIRCVIVVFFVVFIVWIVELFRKFLPKIQRASFRELSDPSHPNNRSTPINKQKRRKLYSECLYFVVLFIIMIVRCSYYDKKK